MSPKVNKIDPSSWRNKNGNSKVTQYEVNITLDEKPLQHINSLKSLRISPSMKKLKKSIWQKRNSQVPQSPFMGLNAKPNRLEFRGSTLARDASRKLILASQRSPSVPFDFEPKIPKPHDKFLFQTIKAKKPKSPTIKSLPTEAT